MLPQIDDISALLALTLAENFPGATVLLAEESEVFATSWSQMSSSANVANWQF